MSMPLSRSVGTSGKRLARSPPQVTSSRSRPLCTNSDQPELVQSGRLRLLTVWSAERAKRFPEVPTLRESGIEIVSASPYGLAGPKGMSPDVVRVLHDAFKEALFDPAHVAILDRFDMAPWHMGPADYTAFARRTYAEEGEMIRKLGLRL